MLTSVIFIAVTILIYVLLPELHNLHGNCLICYLICLGIGYSFTAWMKLDKWNYVRPILCIACGHFMYFFLMSAFLWSNVISFDLWQNLRYFFPSDILIHSFFYPFMDSIRNRTFFLLISSTTNTFDPFNERRKFRFYVVYVLGLSSFLTMNIFILDHFEPFQNILLPGIGVETCFLRSTKIFAI